MGTLDNSRETEFPEPKGEKKILGSENRKDSLERRNSSEDSNNLRKDWKPERSVMVRMGPEPETFTLKQLLFVYGTGIFTGICFAIMFWVI